MPEVSVRMAEGPADFEAARALCREWVDWQLRTFPDRRDVILKVFEPEAYARTLAALPEIHARPLGGILLADLHGSAVGCVMYLEQAPGVAEIKRLFVAEAGRGHGIGRALLLEMFERMRADGYGKVRFSSAKFLTHARRLYEEVGFLDSDGSGGVPGVEYFMERAL